MLKTILIFIIIFTVLLFPIKIKLSLKYINNKLKIYFNSKEISIEKLTKKKAKKRQIKKFSLNDYFFILNRLQNNKFKPKLILKIYGDFGLNDAALTALTYGYLGCLNPILYNLLNYILNVKSIEIKLKPKFSERIFNVTIKCIIIINLANIIYVTLLLLRTYLHIKKNHKSINYD
ncbi:hypothetical protein CLTEP_01090 [Clostridium tepidiprofundi DSM 19306]|uniref:DUF2953 domain-containing protein n=1 Tax=Clostridium tepidiprofundi DSM 19306 TaxID=1121338 RepID=A0A151B736_9CLOT|nr:DUF2953 domain-containing protein [Clostridium tepidiprofundi]KYH35716.1 hypothetical protein CLTEP_01090 [Clostridium tepidiprofundi DSM 19306]